MTITHVISPDLKTVLRRLKLSRMLDTLPERLTLARQAGEGALAMTPTYGHGSRGGARRQLSPSIEAPLTAAERLQAVQPTSPGG